MDHYSTLGINKDASPEDIKRAYRKLASKHHPDKGGDTAEFQRVEEAYRILSDPEQRSKYDNPAPSGFNFNFSQNGQDINLDDIFSRFGFGNPFQNHPNFRHQERRNKDIKASIQLRLAETLTTQNKTLRIQTSDSNVHTVDISIPAGVTSGTTIKYPNLGDNMFGNLPRGDLYITVHVVNNSAFEVSGLDLVTNLTINCFDAILGCEQVVRGLDGKQFIIQTPKGCQPEMKLKISGEGLPAFQKDIRGNLYVRIKVSIPTKLTQQQIDYIEEIKKINPIQ